MLCDDIAHLCIKVIDLLLLSFEILDHSHLLYLVLILFLVNLFGLFSYSLK